MKYVDEYRDREAALDDYGEALRIHPDYADALVARGKVRMDQGELDEARADLDRAIGLDGANPAAWYFRAMLRRQSGDLAGAAQDLANALRVAPPGSRQRVQIEALQRQVQAELGAA